MSTPYSELTRAIREITAQMSSRLEHLDNGTTTLEGWEIRGTNQNLESGNSYLFLTTNGSIYRVTNTSTKKTGSRHFMEPQYENHQTIMAASLSDVGTDNDDILDKLEDTLSYQMSF